MVSQLSSDSDVTVQDDDDEDAFVTGDEEAESAPAGDPEGQDQGEDDVAGSGGPWFERAPSDVVVSHGRTLRCDCVVGGDQPIGLSVSPV